MSKSTQIDRDEICGRDSSFAFDHSSAGINLTQCVAPADFGPKHAHTFRCDLRTDYILANSEQSRTLSTLRGTLLPKLLSREIEVGKSSTAT